MPSVSELASVSSNALAIPCPSALAAACPSRGDEAAVGSLEHVRCCDAFPKAKPLRVASQGQMDSGLSEAEPDIELPFPLLPGEFLAKFGHVSSGTLLFLTNYRLFVLLDNKSSFYNIPLPCIDSVESRDMFYLHISSKDGRVIK